MREVPNHVLKICDDMPTNINLLRQLKRQRSRQKSINNNFN